MTFYVTCASELVCIYYQAFHYLYVTVYIFGSVANILVDQHITRLSDTCLYMCRVRYWWANQRCICIESVCDRSIKPRKARLCIPQYTRPKPTLWGFPAKGISLSLVISIMFSRIRCLLLFWIQRCESSNQRPWWIPGSWTRMPGPGYSIEDRGSWIQDSEYGSLIKYQHFCVSSFCLDDIPPSVAGRIHGYYNFPIASCQWHSGQLPVYRLSHSQGVWNIGTRCPSSLWAHFISIALIIMLVKWFTI